MTPINTNIISEIKQSLGIELPGNIQPGEIRTKLGEYINHLIQSDFEKLVSLLYRIDVSEVKLKQLLKQNPGKDAGKIIAELIIERQEEKIISRSEFKQRDENISDEEKW
jgi:hypothetical protein